MASLLLNDNNFDEAVAGSSKILVDFWAEWCGPCRMVSPILDEISSETGLLIGKLNIDENLEKTKEYAVQTIPTMVLFVDGKPVHIVHGAKPKHALMKELKQWI
jgi:thioredoxin 1